MTAHATLRSLQHTVASPVSVRGPVGVDMSAAEPPGTLPEEVSTIVTRLVAGKRRVRQGEALFRSGTQFFNLFVVRAGMFKTILLDSEGREQVTGFHMTGEVLGLDGIERELHQSQAIALEDSEVWEIPYARLEAEARRDAGVQRLFHRLMSREIQRDYMMMLLLGSMRAEERLAAFLVNLSQRLVARGYSATHFVLRMSRREIGSYLGLTLETVSRVFSRFQREGLIRAELKSVELRDVAALKRMVGASMLNAA